MLLFQFALIKVFIFSKRQSLLAKEKNPTALKWDHPIDSAWFNWVTNVQNKAENVDFGSFKKQGKDL